MSLFTNLDVSSAAANSRKAARNTNSMSIDTDLIQKNLVTFAKSVNAQNVAIIERLDEICKMLYDITRSTLNKNGEISLAQNKKSEEEIVSSKVNQ